MIDADTTLEVSNYVHVFIIDNVHYCKQLEKQINQMCVNCKYRFTLHFMNAMLLNLISVEYHQTEYKTLATC